MASATAAQVAAMDLIISISNTTVHLAGALGVPVWAMLQAIPDRRWMLNLSNSPWYQSVRLFRQKKVGDWTGLICEVEDALTNYVEEYKLQKF